MCWQVDAAAVPGNEGARTNGRPERTMLKLFVTEAVAVQRTLSGGFRDGDLWEWPRWVSEQASLAGWGLRTAAMARSWRPFGQPTADSDLLALDLFVSVFS